MWVTWRIAARRVAKWHRVSDHQYTLCGQKIPDVGTYFQPQYVMPMEKRAAADDTCMTCESLAHSPQPKRVA